MTDEITQAQMTDLLMRIQAARRGEGDMPTREELLACYTQLRQGRAAGVAKTSKGKTAAAVAKLPVDLNDLFA